MFCAVLSPEADLTCSYTADFGSNVRLEWKFKDDKGSQAYVYYDGKPTGKSTAGNCFFQSQTWITMTETFVCIANVFILFFIFIFANADYAFFLRCPDQNI